MSTRVGQKMRPVRGGIAAIAKGVLEGIDFLRFKYGELFDIHPLIPL
jgi:hypothetical protein